MSVLEIVLYIALGLGVTIYVITSIISFKKGKKKKGKDEDDN